MMFVDQIRESGTGYFAAHLERVWLRNLGPEFTVLIRAGESDMFAVCAIRIGNVAETILSATLLESHTRASKG